MSKNWLPWEFHDHFSFYAGIYALKLAKSNKLCHQCFFNDGDVIMRETPYPVLDLSDGGFIVNEFVTIRLQVPTLLITFNSAPQR